jgi:LytS/YehU family sensor histidine kinase
LTVELPPPESLPDVWVPSLILQPIVENAVTHGLAGHERPVKVALAARTEGAVLRLTVTNDMAAEHRGVGGGLGLRNVRERLAVQFGRRAHLTAGPQADGTFVATIELPVLTEMPRNTAPSV